MASIFQQAADFIRALKTPKWLLVILNELQDVMGGILVKAGETYISYVKALIISASKRTELSNGEKLEYVLNGAKASGLNALNKLKENEIDSLVGFLISNFKAKRLF